MTPHRLATLCLVAATTAFRLWFLGTDAWELSPEEAQYWDWSRRLDLSYYSKGPGIAYLIALATRLGSDTALAIRLPAVVLGALLPLVAFRLARETTGSDRIAFWSVAALTAMPLYAAGGLLMTTDTPVVLCWAVAVYAVWRAAGPARGTGWWHAAGAALAAGLLTKYTVLLAVPCLGAFLWTHPKGHALLRGRGPRIVAAWLAAGSIPLLVWNWGHDWVSFRHVAGQATGGGTLWWQSAGETIGVQAGVVSPLLFVAILAGIGHAAARGFGRRDPGPLLLFWTSGPVLGFFFLWSLGGKIQGNWPAPAYFTAAIAAAAWALAWPEDRQRRAGRRRKALLALWAASIILGVAVQAAALAARVNATRTAIPGAPAGAARSGDPPFIASDRYQLASLLAFYVPGHPRTYAVNLGGRLNQYDIWGGLDGERGRNGIFVTYGFQPLPPELERAFERIEVEPRVVVMEGDRLLHGFHIVRGFGFRGFPSAAGPPRY